jgi:hypothetical protein
LFDRRLLRLVRHAPRCGLALWNSVRLQFSTARRRPMQRDRTVVGFNLPSPLVVCRWMRGLSRALRRGFARRIFARLGTRPCLGRMAAVTGSLRPDAVRSSMMRYSQRGCRGNHQSRRRKPQQAHARAASEVTIEPRALDHFRFNYKGGREAAEHLRAYLPRARTHSSDSGSPLCTAFRDKVNQTNKGF